MNEKKKILKKIKALDKEDQSLAFAKYLITHGDGEEELAFYIFATWRNPLYYNADIETMKEIGIINE